MNLLNAIKTVRLFKKQEELIPLKTKWSQQLDPNHVLEDYPRPQMKRDNYINLNGFYHYAINQQKEIPHLFQGEILVPFSPESQLSQVQKQLLPGYYLWYERVLPPLTKENGHYLLHFGAVDQIADIYINHQHVFHHVGGYLPFQIDITNHLNHQHDILTIRVTDDSDTSYHAKGKQRLKRGGMYYTAQSGIWQSVWLEWVGETYIEDVKITPDYDHDQIHVKVILNHEYHQDIQFQINQQVPVLMQASYNIIDVTLPIENKISWDVNSPYLYKLYVSIQDDQVECYFAMRCFSIEKDDQQIPRICLNHQPIFMNGVLDQGYWPDGLYTAPTDEALIYDIETMKSLGFNMIRKHIKIEPARWYYHCDRLGMIVWQDMINGGEAYHTWFVTWMPSLLSWTKKHISDKHLRLLARKDAHGREEWIKECELTIEHLSHFPCISTWVLFNEGWGQFATEKITQYVRQLDPTRLIDSASGWFDQKCGDFRSEHHYFDEPKIISDPRAFVLSECGGYACPIEKHISVHQVYGYQNYTSIQELTQAYETLYQKTINPLIEKGLCACVYTQLSDIEEEVNGLLTYDRKICKIIQKERNR